MFTKPEIRFILVVMFVFGILAIWAARKIPKEMKANKTQMLMIRIFIFLFYLCSMGMFVSFIFDG